MIINITDTHITLENGEEVYPILEKPRLPDYSNVTARPYFAFYHTQVETLWERFCLCMGKLSDFCQEDPYLGCYALLFRRLYSLMLSSNQSKNVAAYGSPPDCGAYRVFQDFMTFSQEGNSLTVLSQNPFSFTILTKSSCAALLYRLDTCHALAAVCDAIERVKPGGLVLLYTLQDTLPAGLEQLYVWAKKDRFASCTVYTLTVDESLSSFARANSSECFILARAEEILKRADDLQNVVSTILAETSCSEDLYTIAAILLQQTEELLLALYDYLEDDELPIRANALKEALLNYYTGICGGFDLTTYNEKLTLSSQIFFAAIEREFQ